MVITASAGLGKSWLLRLFAAEATSRKLPLAQLDFADGQAYDALALVRSGSAGRTYHLPYGVELCIGRHTFELRLHGAAKHRNTWDREVPRV